MIKRYEGINPKETLSKWEIFFNESIGDDIRCCMNIDSIQWNYKDDRLEFIEAEEIHIDDNGNYTQITPFNIKGDINKQFFKYEGERKKLLMIWNTIIKDLKGKGKLYLIFWSQLKDYIRVLEVINVTREKGIEWTQESDKPKSYQEFKKWAEKWNNQGRKENKKPSA